MKIYMTLRFLWGASIKCVCPMMAIFKPPTPSLYSKIPFRGHSQRTSGQPRGRGSLRNPDVQLLFECDSIAILGWARRIKFFWSKS